MNLDKNCGVCKLDKKSSCISPRMQPVFSSSSSEIEYIVVGSMPTKQDDAENKLFSGKSHQKILTALSEAGISENSVLFTSAVRCKSEPEINEIVLCGESVMQLIEHYTPKGVILFGGNAVRAVFPKAIPQAYSVSRIRGSKVPYFTKKNILIPCVITYSPEFLLHANNKDETIEQVWYDDIYSVTKKNEISVDLTPEVIICKTFPLVQECAEKLKTESVVAWDYETTALKPYPTAKGEEHLFSVAFAFDCGKSYAIPLFDYFPSNMQKAVDELIGAFFYALNPTQRKIAHNAKFDMLWGIYKSGKGLSEKPLGEYEDTSLLCWLMDERPGMSRLKVAGFRYFGVKDWSVDVKNVRRLPLDSVLKYNALDAFYTLRLYQYLEPIVCKEEKGKILYREVLMPAVKQFLKIEMRGVHIDNIKLSDFYTEYEGKISESIRKIHLKSGKINLNPGSTNQLQRYFIDDCKYTLQNKTKTGYSTNIEALEAIVKTYDDPVAKECINYRELNKLQTTYIKGLRKHIYKDGKLHGGYNLTATVTGRTSSSDPNMQNFPKRKARKIRSIVTPPKGCKICSFDYGQIEARLFAVVTGDKKYLEDLYNGYDIHLEKALWLYHEKLGMTKEEATKKRSSIKNGGVFPAFYGAGDFSISQNLDIPISLAKEFKSSIFQRYTTIRKWQSEIVRYENENGYIESLFGRRRRSPMAYNELLNFTTQSTASDMTLTAMNYLGRKYDIAFMIHDDLSIFLKDDDKLEENIIYICESMLALPWLYLSKSPLLKAFAPLSVECEVGDNWGDQTKAIEMDSMEAGFDTLEKCVAHAENDKKQLLLQGW